MVQRDPRLIGGVYRISQVISATGILTTCTASNRNTDDMVELFILEVPPAFHPTTVRQLLQPLERRRTIQSPHVIHVFDWGVDGSRAYIVTDPPRGVTLRFLLDTENIDIARAIDITKQLTLGLKALHEQAITGLDLRPLLVTVETTGITDRVQIDDVGLRVLISAFVPLHEQQNDNLTTLDPRYAPPEYIQNKPVGPWSDIYQVGLLLFELITGRLPFVGRNNAETGILQTTSPIPMLQQYKHDAPSVLQSIIDTALAKDPATRFSTADAFLQALENIKTTSSLPLVLSHSLQPEETNEMASLGETTQRIQPTPLSTSSTSQAMQNVPSATGIYAYLVLEQPDAASRQLPLLQKDVVVGRSDPKRGFTPDIDLSSFDPRMTVSRQHARIRFADNFFYLEDLKSRNKTRLGELVLTPLHSELLQHGDEIRFGSVHATFKIPGMTDQPGTKRSINSQKDDSYR